MEIWVSESQERMMLSVSPGSVDEVLHVFKLWDVPATPVGKVIREKSVKLYFQGEKVFDLELEFLTAGPVYCRPCSAHWCRSGSSLERPAEVLYGAEWAIHDPARSHPAGERVR